MRDTLDEYQPNGLAALRIVTSLLFIQHGLQKMIHFPTSGYHSETFVLLSLSGIAGVLETFGGFAIVLGFMTRPVAFILAGQMAVAYFALHFQAISSGWRGFFPIVNGGDSAILFCFVFLYLVVAGPGAWSIDAARGRRHR